LRDLDEIAREGRAAAAPGPQLAEPRRPTVLELLGVGCLRGRTRALDRVDLQVTKGDLHLVIGEPGAGKTTLLELLAGMAQPDRGQLLVRNWHTRIDSPGAALELGISFAAEEPALVESFSVAESVVLGAEPGRGGHFAHRCARRQVADLADRLGVWLDPRAPVSELSLGERRLVEVLALAWREVEVLLLDEPTTGVEPGEDAQLLNALDSLRSQGKTLLVASRAPGGLLRMASRITVLRDGASVASLPGGDSGRERAAALLAEARRPATADDPPTLSGGEPILQVKGLWVTDGSDELLAGIDLDAYQGEIHGVVAAGGRGQLELMETVAGLRSPEGGRVYLDNEDVARSSVRARQALGLVYLPPADGPGGLAGPMRLWENAALCSSQRGHRRLPGLLSPRASSRLAAELAAAAGVAAHPRMRAGLLSRGERQLLALALLLAPGGPPVVLLAAHPTRGLGRKAAERVWDRLRAARDAGVALLLTSADPNELLALADRVTVIAGGRVVAELDRHRLSETELADALALEGSR
jgi:ABC-type uncharacterized transport system ATPase subunit